MSDDVLSVTGRPGGEARLGFLLAIAQRLAAQHYSALLVPLEMTPTQFEVLHLLSHLPNVAVGELAVQYRVAAPVITTMVEDLVRMGLVERQIDPKDRRRSLLAVTAPGRAVLEQGAAIRQQALVDMSADLSPADVERLEHFLVQVIHSLDRAEAARRGSQANRKEGQ